ncbi:MAG: putative DNA-binding domain-containing protein [Porticoccaceae bacterium]|nr:putative DNA-binding domain-containing protein [Porticoccaceae bacterium]
MSTLNTVTTDFQDTQRVWIAHLRNPKNNPPPMKVEARRLLIYQDLIFNNIESFLSGGFPILHSLLSADDWQSLVRGFIVDHECHSPYFLEISQEFLAYLNDQQPSVVSALPFALELSHYEWVELALDVSTEDFPTASSGFTDGVPDGELLDAALLDGRLLLSPLAWRLSYQYPVHKIGPEFQPQVAPDTPTYLLVYRNRSEEVHFLESNAVTFRLLQVLEEGRCSAREALVQIADEIGYEHSDHILASGLDTLKQLLALSIVCGFKT